MILVIETNYLNFKHSFCYSIQIQLWFTNIFKTHLRGVLRCIGNLDLCFLLSVEIWHDVQKGLRSTLSSISFQTFVVYPVNSNMVDLCTNLWCNNYREIIYSIVWFCNLYLFFVFTKNACFLCELCGRVTVFCFLSPKKTI